MSLDEVSIRIHSDEPLRWYSCMKGLISKLLERAFIARACTACIFACFLLYFLYSRSFEDTLFLGNWLNQQSMSFRVRPFGDITYILWHKASPVSPSTWAVAPCNPQSRMRVSSIRLWPGSSSSLSSTITSLANLSLHFLFPSPQFCIPHRPGAWPTEATAAPAVRTAGGRLQRGC